MPACRICKKRIDLSITGVRAHKCKKCANIVCRDHYDFSKGVCYKCADLPIAPGRRAFSFVRKSKDAPQKK